MAKINFTSRSILSQANIDDDNDPVILIRELGGGYKEEFVVQNNEYRMNPSTGERVAHIEKWLTYPDNTRNLVSTTRVDSPSSLPGDVKGTTAYKKARAGLINECHRRSDMIPIVEVKPLVEWNPDTIFDTPVTAPVSDNPVLAKGSDQRVWRSKVDNNQGNVPTTDPQVVADGNWEMVDLEPFNEDGTLKNGF